MADKKYIVTINFTEDFMEDYKKIKDFEIHYREKLMKVQAMPEKTDSNIADKKLALATLQEEFEEIASMNYTKDRYDIRNFYDEVMLEFNTYAQHDAVNDVFVFNDSFTPMFVFAYIAKIYPKVLEYLTKYELSYENSVLVDYMKLLA